MGNSAGLGEARGRITIETGDLQRAAQAARTFAAAIEQSFSRVSTGTQRAERNIDNLAASLSRLGGAFGIVTGIGAVAAIGRFALQADATATAYRRQSVAALSLAGSQEQLNKLLAAYERATGGVIDKAQALGDVTRLQAIGFADSTAELERFTVAARGIALATGQTQDYVISQLQLAIANQSTMRLDQLGLGVSEVQARITQLKAANSGLTEEMIYQNAVLGLAEEKFGTLAKSAAAQKTGAEEMAKAWKNASLEMGQAFGPAITTSLQGVAKEIRGISGYLKDMARDAREVGEALRKDIGALPQRRTRENPLADWLTGGDPLGRWLRTHELGTREGEGLWIRERPGLHTPMGASIESSRRARGIAGDLGEDPRADERRAATLDFQRQIADIERSANEQRLDATRSYESQRSETIANYERTIAREAEDFARQRQRAQEELFRQIADIEDASRRNTARWAADLAERISELTSGSGQRIAEAQENTNKRIAEIERDYQRNRERAERDHRDRLFDAAARLDAVAVFNEQRNFKRQQADADEAHREQLDKLNEQLAERISDEQENLQERIDQENRAHARRLADAKEADDRRIADMREDFVRRQAEEDIDRAVRLRRMAEDHAAQLAAQDAAQADRIKQINRHEEEERKAAEDAHLTEMQELGVVLSKGWKAVQDAIEKAMLESYEDFKKDLAKRDRAFLQRQVEAEAGPRGGLSLSDLTGYASGGWVNKTGPIYAHAGERVLNRQEASRMGSTLNLSDGAIVVYGTPGMSAEDIARAVRGELVDVLRELQ